MSLTPPDGDWSDYNLDDSSTRAWIPEVLDQCLDVLGEHFEQTKSDLARNALVIHVHGRLLFEQLVQSKMWRLRRRVQTDEEEPVRWLNQMTVPGRVAPRTAFIKAFGKNSCDLKVWMPKRLKDRLQSLADDADLPLSEYVRRALTAYYLGRMLADPMALEPEES